MIAFGYEGEADSMKITINSEVAADFRYKTIRDPEKDTLRYWFENLKPETDSLLFTVSKGAYTKDFTVKLKELERDSLKIISSPRGNISPNKDFKITANTPIVTVDKSAISIQNKDSIPVEFTSKFNEKDNSIEISFEKKESQRYNITMLPKTITDFYGQANDTLKYSLATKADKDYGNISVILENVTSYPIILQITDDKEKVLFEKYITEPKPVYNFYSIDPGNIFLRLIYDKNKNGKWDTGNYLKNLQPERIIYFKDKIELRANWDREFDFNVK